MHVLSYRQMDTETLNDMLKVMQQICGIAKDLTHIFQPHLLVQYLKLKTKFPLYRKEQPSLCRRS